jgi:hypothetical protein
MSIATENHDIQDVTGFILNCVMFGETVVEAIGMFASAKFQDLDFQRWV